jgi:hypothetical protein
MVHLCNCLFKRVASCSRHPGFQICETQKTQCNGGREGVRRLLQPLLTGLYPDLPITTGSMADPSTPGSITLQTRIANGVTNGACPGIRIESTCKLR